MNDQQAPTPAEEPEDVIDIQAEWGPYQTQEETDAADAATWDTSRVKVWPAGDDGPVMMGQR